MDEKLNVEESGLNITPDSEKDEKKLQEEITPSIEDEKSNQEEVIDPEDLDKKNYVKITPTFYVQRIMDDETIKDDKEIFKVLNPETSVVEKRELTDEEKREIYLQELRESRIRFKNTVHNGNVTRTQFGTKYKQKRKRKNKLAKASRKTNR